MRPAGLLAFVTSSFSLACRSTAKCVAGSRLASSICGGRQVLRAKLAGRRRQRSLAMASASLHAIGAYKRSMQSAVV
jgi:hypothetical protein